MLCVPIGYFIEFSRKTRIYVSKYRFVRNGICQNCPDALPSSAGRAIAYATPLQLSGPSDVTAASDVIKLCLLAVASGVSPGSEACERMRTT